MTTLVLLPGMDGTGDLLASFVEALNLDIKTLIIRYPESEPLDYDELELFVRDRLPSKEPFILLAESFSGPIAISIAASPPEGLKGLVLCCSFAHNPRPWLKGLEIILPLLPLQYLPSVLLNYFLMGSFSTPSLCSALKSTLAKVTPNTLRTRMKTVLNVNIVLKLKLIQVPLLYLRALKDRTVPRSASNIILQCAPHTQIVDLNGPHFLLQTAPAEAAQAVTAFIENTLFSNLARELIEILSRIIELMRSSQESLRAALTTEQIISILDRECHSLVEHGVMMNGSELVSLFVPTAEIQEISMANDWSKEYLDLSEKFDMVVKKLADSRTKSNTKRE